MTTHDYKTIASIVGEDKIDALRKAGVEIAEKPTKPTMGLFGRWAKHPGYGDVLITVDKPAGDGFVWFAFREDGKRGQLTSKSHIARLTFPEETTGPEDVPAGEAWLVNAGAHKNVTALKDSDGDWVMSLPNFLKWFQDSDVTLIAQLAPVRPTEPETVGTEEEYMALPAGSIVAGKDDHPFTKHTGVWIGPAAGRSSSEMAGKTRRVLRWGWGE